VKYKKNFLTKVVLRIDFQPIPTLLSDRTTPFSEDIKERFPLVNAIQTTQLQVTFGSVGSAFDQQRLGWLWQHTSENGKRIVALAPQYLALEYNAGEFVDFAEFRDTVRFVLNAFDERFGVKQYTRLGLRYIDEIDPGTGDPLDWHNIISADLVTSVTAGMLGDFKMNRSMHQVIAGTGDLVIVFNYGIHNPDYPSPVARRLFVLDLDVAVTGEITQGDALARIDEMNARSEAIFEASIQDGLREIMGIVE
jgi:uncharacterized protein (TIGR04255 family)